MEDGACRDRFALVATSPSPEREPAPPVPGFDASDWLHPKGGIPMDPNDDPFGLYGKPTKYKYKPLSGPPKRDDPVEVLFSAHAMLSMEYIEAIARRVSSAGVTPKVYVPKTCVCMEIVNGGRCKTDRCPYEHDVNLAAQWKYYFSKTPCSGGYDCVRRGKGCHYLHVKPEAKKTTEA